MTEKRPSLTFDYRGYEKQHRPDILALLIDQGNCLILLKFSLTFALLFHERRSTLMNKLVQI